MTNTKIEQIKYAFIKGTYLPFKLERNRAIQNYSFTKKYTKVIFNVYAIRTLVKVIVVITTNIAI